MKDLELLSRHYDFTTRQKERIQDLAKDIAIGFGNYLGENYEYKMHINDEAFFYCIEDEECYYTSQIFNKYLNTL